MLISASHLETKPALTSKANFAWEINKAKIMPASNRHDICKNNEVNRECNFKAFLYILAYAYFKGAAIFKFAGNNTF